MKRYKSLAQHAIKSETRKLLSECKNGNIFLNTENSKINEPHKFVLNLPLDLRSPQKHFALPALSIYHTIEKKKKTSSKNIRIINSN